ncbi:MAG TPA: type IV toxin-antitoxin system AbiEi family antitoxin [Solirubrobacterales bacterium]|nr:type IV toxin-antitoxin system AbiEi family antitoxin [Solirubrobacterales bacterium]
MTMVAVDAIRSHLPSDWTAELLESWPGAHDLDADAMVRIKAPGGETSRVAMQIKRTFETRDVQAVNALVRDLPSEPPAPGALMVIARYLNARVREQLAAEGLAYADATGNLLLTLSKPALFLRDVGAIRDPWRGPGRPRDSFRGSIAARVVRGLVDFAPPMTVPELVKRSDVSTGAGYRVVEFLEREGLLERRKRGPITRVDWRTTLERWAEDYELDLQEGPVRMLEPRGVEAAIKNLRMTEPDGRYVLTGSGAAAFFEKYAQTRLALIYAERPAELADRLGLRPVETGANVLLIRPSDEVVFTRSTNHDGLRVAAPSQIAADLLNGPGRSPNEADALLDWMQSNESIWRH